MEDDLEFMMSLLLRCQDCNQAKPDVEDTFCPYAEEIDGVNEPITVCASCLDDRAMDI